MDTDGDAWVVSSAGTAEIEPSVDRFTVAAAARAGVDVSGHRRRTLTGDLLGTDGADLILTMTRAHLRHVAVLDPSAWTRTFTLLELARRASASAPASDDEPFAAWLGRMGAHRRASEMMRPDLPDDVADPYGGPASEHERDGRAGRRSGDDARPQRFVEAEGLMPRRPDAPQIRRRG
ncbi:MAG: hypothetical protein WKF58_05875 [Ilumatobacteraceae bacterium]